MSYSQQKNKRRTRKTMKTSISVAIQKLFICYSLAIYQLLISCIHLRFISYSLALHLLFINGSKQQKTLTKQRQKRLQNPTQPDATIMSR